MLHLTRPLFAIFSLKFPLLITACLVLAVATLGARSYLMGVRAAATSQNQPQAAAPVQPQSRTRHVETEIITVTTRGFEPQEISRPAGEFILMIENRSGQATNLHFDHETGERLHEVHTSREQPDWNELEDLHPGRYALTEANHPEWVCHVTITSH